MGGPSIIDGVLHEETSNFYTCKFFIDGYEYTSVENYFQAKKATTFEDHEKVRIGGDTGPKAFALGREIQMRADWEEVKIDENYKANCAKFQQNKEIAEKLIQTKGSIKFDEPSAFWTYWNEKIIERVRAELRNTEEDKVVAAKIKEIMEIYRKDPKNFKYN